MSNVDSSWNTWLLEKTVLVFFFRLPTTPSLFLSSFSSLSSSSSSSWPLGSSCEKPAFLKPPSSEEPGLAAPMPPPVWAPTLCGVLPLLVSSLVVEEPPVTRKKILTDWIFEISSKIDLLPRVEITTNNFTYCRSFFDSLDRCGLTPSLATRMKKNSKRTGGVYHHDVKLLELAFTLRDLIHSSCWWWR